MHKFLLLLSYVALAIYTYIKSLHIIMQLHTYEP